MLPRIYRTESEIRKRQINTLKVFNENVTVVAEGYEYQVHFRAGGNDFSITVTLKSDFPNEKPLLKINPVIVHHWVGSDGAITGAPGLLNYTVHSDLGRVVQAIVREFQRTPPPLLDQRTNSITSPTVPIRDKNGRSSPNYQLTFPGYKSFSPPSHIPVATNTIPQSVAIPELNLLTLEELQFLNESTDRQDEFLDNLPPMREMNKTVDDLMVQIGELTDSNLSKQEELEELRKGIDSRIADVTKLAFENEQLYMKYQAYADKYSPKNILDELSKAAGKADEESDKIADDFLNGRIDVEKFLSVYLKTRALCQTRKTKEEKFSQQLNSLEKAGF